MHVNINHIFNEMNEDKRKFLFSLLLYNQVSDNMVGPLCNRSHSEEVHVCFVELILIYGERGEYGFGIFYTLSFSILVDCTFSATVALFHCSRKLFNHQYYLR